MKVVQTVFGKFHHFDLARQLHQYDMLEAIFTAYPRWKLHGEELPAAKIKTFPWVQTLLMGKWRYGFINPWIDRELSWLMAETLDAHVASRLPECDVFIGISGSGLRTSRIAKARGRKYICDRGSSHVRFADRLLDEEFKRWGQSFVGIDPRALAKEEQEYASADIITLPSRFCVRSFLEMGINPAKIRRIPYGVELNRFRQQGTPPSEAFEVLFVGQVSFRKGFPYLLAAFQRLKHPRKRLRVVGAMQPELKIFLQDKHLDDIEFLGSIPQAQLAAIMSTSHVMVLPSIEDGFGLVIGQAMACGCPVICSQNTGGEDVFQDRREGFIIPIRDASTLAQNLEQLCQDRPLRNRMGEAAIRRVKTLGGWNEYGRQYRELCVELAGLSATHSQFRSEDPNE